MADIMVTQKRMKTAFTAWHKPTKTMRDVLVIDWLNDLIDLSGGLIEQDTSTCDLYQKIGLLDKNQIELVEGDLVIGYLKWCDGYLGKGYPELLQVIFEIVYTDGKFYLKERGVLKKHQKAGESGHYREIQATLSPQYLGGLYFNPQTRLFDIIGDGLTCSSIEKVGHITDIDESLQNQFIWRTNAELCYNV